MHFRDLCVHSWARVPLNVCIVAETWQHAILIATSEYGKLYMNLLDTQASITGGVSHGAFG